MDEEGAVGDREGFTDGVVGDEDGEAVLFAEFADDALDVLDGDGVDAGERFVEHENLGIGAEGAGDGETALLAAGEGDGEGFRNLGDAEAVEQIVGAGFLVGAREAGAGFQDGQ